MIGGSRYFAPRYFASRYWPKLGFGQAVIIPGDIVPMTVRFARSVVTAARFTRSLTVTVER